MRLRGVLVTLRAFSGAFIGPHAAQRVLLVFAMIAGWSTASLAQAPVQGQDRDVPASVIFARVSPSTLVVQCELREGMRQGSSVVIDAGQVVTSYHVVEGALSIQVRQGNQSWPAKLLAFDQQHDLAILGVPQLDRPKVSLRASSQVKVGERVYAVGAPRGLELSLSDGLVAALRTTTGELAKTAGSVEKDAKKDAVEHPSPGSAASLIQTTAPVSPGSSGGGLFDSQGRLVGIITFVASGQNLNFAHPVEWVSELRDSKLSGKTPLMGPKRQSPFTVANRPAVLVCQAQTTSMWALFSRGSEILETTSASGRWRIDVLHTQLPRYKRDTDSGEGTEVVLADLDRESGFARFTRTSQGPRYDLFLWQDDDGEFHMTSLEALDFHGQVRLRTISSACSSPHADYSVCKTGSTLLCIQEAKNSLKNQQPIEAMELYGLACERGDPVGCDGAARLYEVSGMAAKAKEMRDRAELLRKKHQ